jgi:hypothetical protein
MLAFSRFGASSVRSYRTSYAIIKASVTVWLCFYPYIDLQIPPLACGRILPQYHSHCPTGCSVDSAAQAACTHPTHSTGQPTPATPIRLQSNHQFSRHALKMGCIRKDLIVLCTAFLHSELWLVYPLKRRVRDISPGGS